MKRLLKNQKGFSLLELLVAVSLLAVGLLAAASMQGVALNSNSLANRISTSAMIAQQAMEDINSWPRNDGRLVAVGEVNYDLNPDPAMTTRWVPGSGTYSATYTITPNTPVTGVSRIDVTITRMDVDAGIAARPDITASGERRIIILTSFKRTT